MFTFRLRVSITSPEVLSFFVFYSLHNCYCKLHREELAEVVPAKWNFSSTRVNTINEYRRLRIMFFSSIEDEPGDWKKKNDQCCMHCIFLRKSDTKTFSLVLWRIFPMFCLIALTSCLYCAYKVYSTIFCRRWDSNLIWTEITSISE